MSYENESENWIMLWERILGEKAFFLDFHSTAHGHALDFSTKKKLVKNVSCFFFLITEMEHKNK